MVKSANNNLDYVLVIVGIMLRPTRDINAWVNTLFLGLDPREHDFSR